MSYGELLDWIDFWELEPFGSEVAAARADVRNGLLCKIVSDFQYWLAGEKSPHEVTTFTIMQHERKAKEEAKRKREAKLEEPAAEQQEGKRRAEISSELLTQLFLASAPGTVVKPAKVRRK